MFVALMCTPTVCSCSYIKVDCMRDICVQLVDYKGAMVLWSFSLCTLVSIIARILAVSIDLMIMLWCYEFGKYVLYCNFLVSRISYIPLCNEQGRIQGGSLGSGDPPTKHIREAKGMMCCYKKCAFSWVKCHFSSFKREHTIFSKVLHPPHPLYPPCKDHFDKKSPLYM